MEYIANYLTNLCMLAYANDKYWNNVDQDTDNYKNVIYPIYYGWMVVIWICTFVIFRKINNYHELLPYSYILLGCLFALLFIAAVLLVCFSGSNFRDFIYQ